MKTDIIINSKNRACQLDLLLRSIRKYYKNIGKIFILAKATTEAFMEGYINVSVGGDVNFRLENNYAEDLKNILNKMTTEYFLMCSDDCVFLEDTEIPDNFELAKDEVHLSLRLSTHNNYCQPGQFGMTPPEFEEYEDDSLEFIRWDWTKASRGDYAYQASPDSNIWNRQYFIDRLSQFPFKTLKDVEIGLDTHRDMSKPCMLSFKEVKLISIAANCVWPEGQKLPNRGVSLEMLNRKFLEGKQIKLPEIIKPSQCHTADYEYEFEDKINDR